MSDKYAVYIRVSTDRDEQVSSVENQIDICRNWLERSGYAWDENRVYKDEGISGTFFSDRPAIQVLLKKAKKKEIDMVLFKSISRLARDLKDSLEIREIFTSHNVRIISIEEGYDSHKAGKNDMAFELWSLFSAQYSRTLSAGISAALAAKVRRGEHIGRVPYGYDRIEGVLKVNEEEARVVQIIYNWYNEGWGFKRITNELNNQMIRSKLKGKWQVTSVQRLIQNPIYCGDFILNQYSKVKQGGRKKQIRNSPEQWIRFENHHDPIVPREIWEKANPQNMDSKRTKITLFNELRGIAKCSKCGSNMVIVQSWKTLASGEKKHWKYMKCSLYRRAGEHGCVNHQPILYEDLKAFILNRLIEKGRDVSLDFDSHVTDKKQMQTLLFGKRITKLEEKKNALVDLYLDRLLTKTEFETKKQELDREIREYEGQLHRLEDRHYSDLKIKTIQQAFQVIGEQGKDLHKAFTALLDEIVVHPDGTVDIAYTFEQGIVH